MKVKLFFIFLFFSFLSLWIFKREIGLALLPIAININNPVAENQEIDCSQSLDFQQLDYLYL